MPFILVVKTPFGEYQRGQHITDQSIIDAIEASEQAHFCVRVNAPTPAPTKLAAE
jgi:hypothetical protein